MGARRGAAAIASPLSAFKKREGDRPSNRRVASADGAVLNCKSPSFSPNSESERDVTLHSIFKQAHSSARVTFFTTPHSQTSQQYHSRGSRQGVRSIERINIPGDRPTCSSLAFYPLLPPLFKSMHATCLSRPLQELARELPHRHGSPNQQSMNEQRRSYPNPAEYSVVGNGPI